MKNYKLLITDEFKRDKILGQAVISDVLYILLESYLDEFLSAQREGIDFNKRLVIKPSGIKIKNGYEISDLGLFIENDGRT